MILPSRTPHLLVVSAPSGGGKTTLCGRLLEEFPDIVYSISCTTRPPRPGEVHGRSYLFLTDEEFDARVRRGDFLEHANVHGARYGTLKSTVLDGFAAGRDVLMDVDIQGAAQIRDIVQAADRGDPMRGGFVDIFIAPPSIETLAKRLSGRGQDDPDVIERRLHQAGRELSAWSEYTYVIVNDELDASYDVLRAIVLAERHRVQP